MNLTEAIANINPLLAEQISKNSWFLPLIILQIVAKLAFYPLALYKAGVRKQKVWFIVLFIGLVILNDFGLLAILYLVFNREMPKSKKKKL